MWHRNMTPNIKTQMYQALIKSTLTYADIEKLNSTEMIMEMFA